MIHQFMYGKPWYIRMAVLAAVGAIIMLEVEPWGESCDSKSVSAPKAEMIWDAPDAPVSLYSRCIPLPKHSCV